MMTLTKRNYTSEEDYWRVREFLRKVFQLNSLRPMSWPAARLDYWRWHVTQVVKQRPIEEVIFFWETPQGEIAASLTQEVDGDVFLNIHPEHQNPDLIDEMIATAEQSSYRVTQEHKKRLMVWAHEHDTIKQEILAGRGFIKKEDPDWQERQRQRNLDLPLPEFETAAGYEIRSLGGLEEIPSRSWASWRSFHPDAPDQDYQGWDWYPQCIQTQPMYRRDLDLVAIAPDGTVAAFTTLWYDDVTRWGYFEPVGTVPEHQRNGLGKAVMIEGMRRVKAMGGLVVGVSGYSVAANKLYSAVVSEDCLVNVPWIKEWQA